MDRQPSIGASPELFADLLRSEHRPTRLQRASGLDPPREILLKREDEGPIGAFKWRGALAVCAELQREGSPGVVVASTGNHGAAVAWAASRLGLEAHVVVPEDASAAKCGLIEHHRASLVRFGSTVSDADRWARRLAADLGLVYFEDGSLDVQIAGTATVGLELAHVEADTVVVPVGCGALAAGIGLALAQAERPPRVIGVQSTGFGHLAARFHGLNWSEAERGATLADGLADTRIVEPAFGLCRAHVDDMLLVDDDAIADAMRELWQVLGLVVEGAAAAPLAALRCYPELDWGHRVVLIVSGRNLDASLAARIGIPGSTRERGDA